MNTGRMKTSINALVGALLFGAIHAEAAPPVNDNLADRISLGSTSPVTFPGTNVEATLEPGDPISFYFGESRTSTVWWEWTSPFTGTARIGVETSDFDIVIGVGTLNGSGDFVEEAHDAFSSVRFEAVSGVTYVICVAGWLGFGTEEGTFELSIGPDEPVVINSISLDRRVATPTEPTVTFSVGLSHSAGIEYVSAGFVSKPDYESWLYYDPFETFPLPPSSGDPFSGVWQIPFTFPPGAEEGVWTLSYLSVQDGNFDYRFLDEQDLQTVGSPITVVYDDPSNGPLLFDISAQPEPAVGGTVAGGGSFSFADNTTLVATPNAGFEFVGWRQVDQFNHDDTIISTSPNLPVVVEGDAFFLGVFRPQNDDFAHATDLGNTAAVTSASGWNAGGTVEVDEPGDVFEGDQTTWWTWESPVDGRIEIDTVGSDFDTVLTVFTGNSLADLQIVGQSHDAAPDGSSRVAFVGADRRYWIRVHGEGGTPEGEVKISIATQSAATTADDHVAWGKAWLRFPNGQVATGNSLNAALGHFTQAESLDPNHQEALFYLALCRLALLQKESAFDDLLVALGVVDANADSNDPLYEVPTDAGGKSIFAADANTQQGLDYLRAEVAPRLEEVIALLVRIRGNAWVGNLPDWIGVAGYRQTKLIDLGDVTLLRSSAIAGLAILDLLESFELAASLEDLADLESLEKLDVENVADAFSDLLDFSGNNQRGDASRGLRQAIDLYMTGSAFARGPRPSADDPFHLFSVSETGTENEAENRRYLAQAKRSLGGSVETVEGWGINLSRFFATTRPLRELAGNFKTNQSIAGSVPDPKFDRLLPRADRNQLETALRENDLLYEGDLSLTVTVATGQETFGSAGSDITVPAATEVTALASANVGYAFALWDNDGQLASTDNPHVFPLIDDTVLEARFIPDRADGDRDGLDAFSEMEAGTFPDNPDSDGDGLPDGLDPNPLVSEPLRFSISEDLNLSVALQSGSILGIIGLPPGTRFDRVTNSIVGRPTSVRGGESQTFRPVALVRGEDGSRFRLELELEIVSLPESAIGNFTFVAGAHPGEDLGNGLGGQFDFLVTSSGRFSGRLMFAGRTYPVRGALETALGGVPKVMTTASRRGLPDLSVDIELRDDDTVFGAILNEALDFVTGDGWRLVWHKRSNPVTDPFAAYFTALLPPDAVDGGLGDPGVPQGVGYTTLRTLANGRVNWRGRQSDGAHVSRSLLLGPEGGLLLWAPLYRNGGSLRGAVTIDPGDGSVSGDLAWTKFPETQRPGRNYPDGFESGLDVVGGPYSPDLLAGSIGTTLLDQDPNVLIDFESGGLEDASLDPDVEAGLVQGRLFPLLRIPRSNGDPLDDPNPAKAAIRLAVPSGIFSGSMLLLDTDPGTGKPLPRRVPCFGVVTPGSPVFGGGAFLLPQLPDPDAAPPTTIRTSPILSGDIEWAPMDP